jgi:hypothetical protein
MSDSQPFLPLGLGDLEGLQHVITLYLRHCKTQGKISSEREQHQRMLRELHTRIERARLSGADPVCLPLTLAEWQGLKKALNGCAWVVRTHVPHSAERDDLLTVLERLKQEVAQIISASLN